MSIRAEDKPKAFEAQFLSINNQVSKYGDFDFKPGRIVSSKNIHSRLWDEMVYIWIDFKMYFLPST